MDKALKKYIKIVDGKAYPAKGWPKLFSDLKALSDPDRINVVNDIQFEIDMNTDTGRLHSTKPTRRKEPLTFKEIEAIVDSGKEVDTIYTLFNRIEKRVRYIEKNINSEANSVKAIADFKNEYGYTKEAFEALTPFQRRKALNRINDIDKFDTSTARGAEEQEMNFTLNAMKNGFVGSYKEAQKLFSRITLTDKDIIANLGIINSDDIMKMAKSATEGMVQRMWKALGYQNHTQFMAYLNDLLEKDGNMNQLFQEALTADNIDEALSNLIQQNRDRFEYAGNANFINAAYNHKRGDYTKQLRKDLIKEDKAKKKQARLERVAKRRAEKQKAEREKAMQGLRKVRTKTQKELREEAMKGLRKVKTPKAKRAEAMQGLRKVKTIKSKRAEAMKGLRKVKTK